MAKLGINQWNRFLIYCLHFSCQSHKLNLPNISKSSSFNDSGHLLGYKNLELFGLDHIKIQNKFLIKLFLNFPYAREKTSNRFTNVKYFQTWNWNLELGIFSKFSELGKYTATI